MLETLRKILYRLLGVLVVVIVFHSNAGVSTQMFPGDEYMKFDKVYYGEYQVTDVKGIDGDTWVEFVVFDDVKRWVLFDYGEDASVIIK